MKRATYKRLVKYAMFLLPALVALLAYTSFYDRLYKDADCIINCDDYDFNASRELQLNFQKMMALLNTKPQTTSNRASLSTRLDLAFLDEKMAGLESATIRKNSAALVSTNAGNLLANDLNNADINNTLDPIGLLQTANIVPAKQTITQPDSLAASINGMNPPIIIGGGLENGASSASPNSNSPNSNSGAGITPTNNADPNTVSTPLTNPIVTNPAVMNHSAAINTVPLPSSLYLMMAGLAILFMLNRSARTY